MYPDFNNWKQEDPEKKCKKLQNAVSISRYISGKFAK